MSAIPVTEPTKIESLTTKQQAVVRPLVNAIAKLAGPLALRDRYYYERRVLKYGADLYRMRRTLEDTLTSEDERLRSEGTTDDLDDRWIRNLRRLEVICDLLNQAKTVVPTMKAGAR